jgi:hypothetical protein
VEGVVIGGIIGVVGGVLGSVASVLANYKWIEKPRWEREDRNRYQENRMRAYVSYLAALDLILYEMSDSKLSFDQLTDSFAEMSILASPAVIEAANRLFDATRHAIENETVEREGPYEWILPPELWKRKEDFRDAVREELGVSLPEQVSDLMASDNDDAG